MNILKNNKGFSLAEIIIAMGLIGMVAVGSMSLMKMDVNSEKRVNKKTNSMLFLSGIGKYFGSGLGCSEFENQVLPVAFTDFIILNYDGYGALDGGAGITQPIGPGFDVASDFSKIQAIQFRSKPGVTAIDKFIEGVAYEQRILQVKLSIRSGVNGKKLLGALDGNTKPYYFEFPVLTSAATGEIEICSVGMTPREICNALQLVHDPGTGLCIAGAGSSSCVFRGSFIRTTCLPGGYACAPSYPGTTITNNQFTGSDSCPANSSAVQSGNFSSSRRVSCGKKCSVTVTTTENYYICLDCP